MGGAISILYMNMIVTEQKKNPDGILLPSDPKHLRQIAALNMLKYDYINKCIETCQFMSKKSCGSPLIIDIDV